MKDALSTSVVDWRRQQDALQSIRSAVFIDEQRVPKHLEWDGLDPECTQFLACVGARPVATARLTPQGQIGRMAVLKDCRGQGIGSNLLTAVLDQARQQGFEQVFLHAQVNVIPFYRRHGFIAEGDVFLDAGIEHQTMRLVF